MSRHEIETTPAALPAGFLEARLVRRERWERREDGRVVVLLPRFRRGLLARWLQPRLRGARRHLRLNLDELGSFVWERADGATPVAALLDEMGARFPAADDLPRRVRTFVDRLLREGFVVVAGPPEAPLTPTEPESAP